MSIEEKLYQKWLADERQLRDRENNVITKFSQLRDYDVQELVRAKEGVARYRATHKSGNSQIIGYAKDSVFAHLQLPK